MKVLIKGFTYVNIYKDVKILTKTLLDFVRNVSDFGNFNKRMRMRENVLRGVNNISTIYILF